MQANNPARVTLAESLAGRRILFVATKEASYIRNTQEISLLKELSPDVSVCVSQSKSYLLRLLYVYSRLLFRSMKRYDVVFIGFAPQLLLPFLSFKFRKKTIIIDFFISLYDTLVHDRKRFKADGLLSHVLKVWDCRTLKHADLIISDTKAHGAYFCEQLGAEPKKILTLYLQANAKIYQPNPAITADDSVFTVLYFGSILPLQGVDIVLNSAKILSHETAIRFVLIGPLNDEQVATSKDINTLTTYHWLSQKALSDEIQKSDLCLAGHFSADIQKAQRTIPGKAYIYRAMNKPMILGECKANRELFSEDDMTFFVKQGDADALAGCIMAIYRQKQKAHMG